MALTAKRTLIRFYSGYGVTVVTSPLPFDRLRTERADAARNREHLLAVAREMIAEVGVNRLTTDGLAERAEVGQGTVFRRFGNRAGIFTALLDQADREFQELVFSGPAPLGPGAGPVARLVAYGRARVGFLFEHHAIVRAALDREQPMAIAGGGMSPTHIRMLLGQARREGLLEISDLDTLAVQLAAALEGPLMLYLGVGEDAAEDSARRDELADSWEILIERVLTAR